MLHNRRITMRDVPAITALALDAMRSAEPLPVHIDPTKIERMVTGFAIDPAHFNLAAFDGPVPVAGVAAYKVESPFFERCEAHVMMCWSVLPGAGTPLIRGMLKWFAKDITLRRLVWVMNDNREYPETPRFARMIRRRYGFDSSHEMLAMYKGVN